MHVAVGVIREGMLAVARRLKHTSLELLFAVVDEVRKESGVIQGLKIRCVVFV